MKAVGFHALFSAAKQHQCKDFGGLGTIAGTGRIAAIGHEAAGVDDLDVLTRDHLVVMIVDKATTGVVARFVVMAIGREVDAIHKIGAVVVFAISQAVRDETNIAQLTVTAGTVVARSNADVNNGIGLPVAVAQAGDQGAIVYGDLIVET